uniref:DUF1014-domain-containing protein n=1 Tax=Caenorhabditis tropicalis TaxID=1561998 RepID=A0A1I7TPX6_9PELO
MALHRRIPKKNRKKLKSVDPFNNKANAARFQDSNKQSNQAPVNLKDEQPLTKAMKSMMSANNPIVTKEEAKKRKKQKNAVLKQAEELGMKKGKFETQEAKRREEADKAKEQRKAEKRKLKEEEKKEESVDDDESDEDDEDGEEPKKIRKVEGDDEKNKKSQKLSKKERRKETLKARKADEQKRKAGEVLINSREVIEFGERYDAPPTFAGSLKKKFEPLMAKAGQKTLLLHSMLQKGAQKTEYLNDSTKIQEERQRVIDAYRNIKKQRNVANGYGRGNPSSE